MRQQDKPAFFNAARDKFWILVRDTNEFSLEYIGKNKFTPKEIDCKAKTANNTNHKLKGLVVDPYTHPDAFAYTVDKLGDVRKFWDKMEFKSGKYVVDRDKNSKFYGCLMCKGNYIHGDYDLYDIIDIKQPHRNLALCSEMKGMEHRVGANLWKVMNMVNAAIGVPMIQHGGEAQFTKHTEQKIHLFGPYGQYGLVEKLEDLKKWYKVEFGGRITLADSFSKHDKNSSQQIDKSKVVFMDEWKKKHGR